MINEREEFDKTLALMFDEDSPSMRMTLTEVGWHFWQARAALAAPVYEPCGACGDGCKDRGSCRIEDESPKAAPVQQEINEIPRDELPGMWDTADFSGGETEAPVQQEPVACPYCDGTGDVHRADGEWLGECTACNANQPDHAEALEEAIKNLVAQVIFNRQQGAGLVDAAFNEAPSADQVGPLATALQWWEEQCFELTMKVATALQASKKGVSHV